eukprot:3838297-Pleurochrysis_carterae.AAC.3
MLCSSDGCVQEGANAEEAQLKRLQSSSDLLVKPEYGSAALSRRRSHAVCTRCVWLGVASAGRCAGAALPSLTSRAQAVRGGGEALGGGAARADV